MPGITVCEGCGGGYWADRSHECSSPDTHPQGGDVKQAPFMGSGNSSKGSRMTHDPVITEAMLKAGNHAFEMEMQRTGLVDDDDLVRNIYLAMHRTNPVVDVEGMVERVAEALWLHEFEGEGRWPNNVANIEEMRSLARAAIEALNSQGGL